MNPHIAHSEITESNIVQKTAVCNEVLAASLL